MKRERRHAGEIRTERGGDPKHAGAGWILPETQDLSTRPRAQRKRDREKRGAPGSSGDEGDGLPRRCAPRSDRGKRKPIPHLFAKVTVIYCVAFASLASVWALWIADKDGLEVTGLLGVILALFGGELLLLCLKTVLTKRKTPAETGEKEGEI